MAILQFFCRQHNKEGLAGTPNFTNVGPTAWKISMIEMACRNSEDGSCREDWDYVDLSIDPDEEFS